MFGRLGQQIYFLIIKNTIPNRKIRKEKAIFEFLLRTISLFFEETKDMRICKKKFYQIQDYKKIKIFIELTFSVYLKKNSKYFHNA